MISKFDFVSYIHSIDKVYDKTFVLQKLVEEITSMCNPILQTIRLARQYLDDDMSDWSKTQKDEVESTIADIEQMLEVVSDQLYMVCA